MEAQFLVGIHRAALGEASDSFETCSIGVESPEVDSDIASSDNDPRASTQIAVCGGRSGDEGVGRGGAPFLLVYR